MKASKKAVFAVLGAALLALILGNTWAILRVAPTVDHALRISQLLQPITTAENQTMHISAAAEVNGDPVTLESDIFLVTEAGTSFLALEQGNSVVYVADNLLLLENGRAFRIGETMARQTASWQNLLPHIGALFDALKITAEETETAVTYSVTVNAEQADTLLEAVSLGDSLPVEAIKNLKLQLTEEAGALKQIRLSGEGALEGTHILLDVTLSGFRILAPGDYPIPEPVRQTAATADPEKLFSLTEDLYRLVLALEPLADFENLEGTLDLAVDCGLLQLDTELNLSDLTTDAPGQVDPAQLQALPEALGLLCMEGDLSCTPSGSEYVYTLSLDEDAMEQLSRMLLPELGQYGVSLTEGTVTILLEDSTAASIGICIQGAVPALFTQIPASLSATFTFTSQ